jgi:phosphatidylglycerol lysyltransferase
LRVRQWDFSPPSVGFALLQLLISALDLIVVAAVLYVLMPASLAVNYLHFLTIYLLALVAGLFSQVPGGLGVFEVVILIVLNPSEPPLVAGSLLAYRVIYYLIPLSVGLLLLSGNEIAVNRRRVGKIARVLGHGTRFLAPRVLAVTVFLAGTMLLFSGATPPAHGRLRLLREILPLPVIEVSHFFGSVVGLLLILLARGLQRRVVTAYYTATILLASGIAFSLLKGFDYEEAAILALMLCLFLPCRRHFYRKGALYDVRTSPGWLVGAGLVIACTAWLMVFSYKHIEYSNELWWQFAFEDSAPRSLRAMAGVALLTLGFAVSRLLRAKPKPPAAPTPDDLATVRQIVARCPSTEANLALLGDKYFLFNNQRTTFIMYGTEGRSWISMGDPVGEEEASRELIWDFRELCDEGGRWPVFYQVDEERVSMYVEMGLTLIKLGEEARVSLSEFGLEGGNRKGLRRTNRQLAEQGCTFELVEPPLEDALLSELRKISDNWLAEKKTAEKGFSLGFFQPDYLRHAPAALVRQHGQLIAFANVLRGAGNEELSLDLMRYQAASPASVMEYLFIQLMLWGKQQGYRWFNLGMAPLAGIDAQRLGPLWNRFAALAYRHGENFYNFQGLRQYKEKFDPIWTAKYLASPGGLALPVILTNVATLISGGLKELVKK